MNGRRHIYLKWCKILSRFFFDHVGAKRKAHFATQSCKKKAPKKGFRALRSATRTPRPRPRRLLEKAGENFHSILTKANHFAYSLYIIILLFPAVCKRIFSFSAVFAHFFAVSGAICAPTNRKSAARSNRSCAPRVPELTVTRSKFNTLSSNHVGNFFFIPMGEQPPRI